MAVAERTLARTELRSPESLKAMTWRRLRRDWASMAALALIVALIGMALFADVIAPYPYAAQQMNQRFEGPSLAHPFGTDQFGRDVLSRIIYGSRVSLSVGLISVGIALLFGIPMGAAAGYFGKNVDVVLSFIMDVMIAFPGLLLAIAIASSLGPSIQNAMIAIGIVEIPRFARLIRSSVLSIRGMDYVDAARTLGASSGRIIALHVMPNILAIVIVRSTLALGGAILTEAGLSFIGLGAQPPFPSWGGMLNDGREHLRRAAHITVVPGIFIMLTVLAFNLLGDGMRDALDPRLK